MDEGHTLQGKGIKYGTKAVRCGLTNHNFVRCRKSKGKYAIGYYILGLIYCFVHFYLYIAIITHYMAK